MLPLVVSTYNPDFPLGSFPVLMCSTPPPNPHELIPTKNLFVNSYLLVQAVRLSTVSVDCITLVICLYVCLLYAIKLLPVVCKITKKDPMPK